ncbi:MAG: hypothetical protein V8T24_11055 [Roseburia hominis]
MKSLDAAEPAEKQVRFETQELLVTESNVEAAVPLVGAATTLTVVPDGCGYVDEVDGVSLDERLLRKYGKKLYINGDVSLDANSTPYLAHSRQPSGQPLRTASAGAEGRISGAERGLQDDDRPGADCRLLNCLQSCF